MGWKMMKEKKKKKRKRERKKGKEKDRGFFRKRGVTRFVTLSSRQRTRRIRGTREKRRDRLLHKRDATRCVCRGLKAGTQRSLFTEEPCTYSTTQREVTRCTHVRHSRRCKGRKDERRESKEQRCQSLCFETSFLSLSSFFLLLLLFLSLSLSLCFFLGNLDSSSRRHLRNDAFPRFHVILASHTTLLHRSAVLLVMQLLKSERRSILHLTSCLSPRIP